MHRKQVTVCIRDEQGTITLRRQVSTRPGKIREFLDELGEHPEGYLVILEVCGFHDWLVRLLREQARCRDVLVIQPEKRSKKKTDRRDANHLSELLWVNRQRLLAGQKVQGVRCVYQPTHDEQQDRQLTSVQMRLVWQRTRTLNQIHYILRRHNLEWDCPTKTFQTRKVRQWLTRLPLGEMDRLELDQLLAQWDLWDRQLEELAKRISARFDANPAAHLLGTIVGVSCYMALAISSRVGAIERFAHGRSLANFFGLTPGSRSSGETERLGSITKEGSRQVRFLLGQLVLHVLRKDGRMRAWYKRIKQRRGSKIARVAVMRRLTVIMWHMLKRQEAWCDGGAPLRSRPTADQPPLTQAELKKHRRTILDSLQAASGAAESSTGSSSLVAEETVPCRV